MGLLNLQSPRNQLLSSVGLEARAGVLGSDSVTGSGRGSRPGESSPATSREKKSGAAESGEAQWTVEREISLRKTESGSWWSEGGDLSTAAAEEESGGRVS